MVKEYTYYQSAHLSESNDTVEQQPTRQVANGYTPGQRILPKEAANLYGANIQVVPFVPSEMSEENTCSIGKKDVAIGLVSGGLFYATTLACSAVGVGPQAVGAGISALCCTLFGRSAAAACDKGCSDKEPMSNALIR